MQALQNNNIKKPDPLHLFISGGAGTGKSHLIKALYHTIELTLRREGENPECPKVLLLAPTGTAAFNIEGATIHSALLFSLQRPSTSKRSNYANPLSDDKRNTLRIKLSQLKFLIIDEISMVGSDFFIEVHNRLTEIMGVHEIFGGLSILAVGDMYQLPPVHQRFIFQPPNNLYAALTPSLWSTHFKYMELTQIMRQSDDKTFSEILNRVRTGSQTTEDIQALKSRLINKDDDVIDSFLHVFATNAKVDEHNIKKLHQLSTEKVHLQAIDKKPSSMKNFSLSTDDRFTGGFPSVITICIGARIILTRNIDVSDGLANGTQGIVRDIIFVSGTPIAVIVLFDSQKVGKNARINSKIDLSPYDEAVVPVFQLEATFSPSNSKVTVSRKQFPLRLCWATSIHKVQGATLQNIVVSFENRFNSGQAYVALSRVKKLENLFLTSFDDKKILTSAKVVTEMNRLNDVKHPSPFPAVSGDRLFSVALLNARSAKKHFHDILAHPLLSTCNVLCLTESNVYTNSAKHYIRGGWTLKLLGKSLATNCHGLMCYCCDLYPVNNCTSTFVPHMEQLNIELFSNNLISSLLLVYHSPSSSQEDFLNDLCVTVNQQNPDLILGDFNTKFNTRHYDKYYSSTTRSFPHLPM